MKITVNYPTGNWFEDGTIEIGKVQEAEIFTCKDLDNLLDDIPEGKDYFLADADGNRVEAYDIMKDLDEDDKGMKNYEGMGYAEFMSEMDEYIATLKQGESLTEKEWTAWIAQEAKDHDEELTDEQIGWIVEKLDNDGFVKEEGKTLFEISMNPYMDTIEFEGTLEEAKKEAEEMIAYNQYDIVIYENDEEVTRRRWCGIAPSEEDEEEDIIEIGDGFYSDWT